MIAAWKISVQLATRTLGLLRNPRNKTRLQQVLSYQPTTPHKIMQRTSNTKLDRGLKGPSCKRGGREVDSGSRMRWQSHTRRQRKGLALYLPPPVYDLARPVFEGSRTEREGRRGGREKCNCAEEITTRGRAHPTRPAFGRSRISLGFRLPHARPPRLEGRVQRTNPGPSFFLSRSSTTFDEFTSSPVKNIVL
jgi:hypothetical protein